MLTSSLLALLTLTSSSFALPSPPSPFPPHLLLPRQSPTITFGPGSDSLPQLCEPICSPFIPILDACAASPPNLQGCLEVCKVMEEFVQCANCALVNDESGAGTGAGGGEELTRGRFTTAERQLEGIVRTCVATGQQAPETQLVTFDQIGSNVTSPSDGTTPAATTTTAETTQPSSTPIQAPQADTSTSGAERQVWFGSRGAMVVTAFGIGGAMLI